MTIDRCKKCGGAYDSKDEFELKQGDGFEIPVADDDAQWCLYFPERWDSVFVYYHKREHIEDNSSDTTEEDE